MEGRWYVFVRTSNSPGSGVVKQYIQASNSWDAQQIAKSLYGPLLVNESPMFEAGRR